MEIRAENVEKLNVGEHPGARLCKGLLLDAIEAGDKLESRVNELEAENERLPKIVRHQKYKRCLTMAEWCDAEADVADADGDYDDMRWYQKWHTRWLDIAKKFKE